MKGNRFNNPDMRTELKKFGKLENLRQLVERCEIMYKDMILFTEKQDGIVMSYTASKFKEDVEAFATELLHMGFTGRQVSIVGENSYAWVVAYFAISCSGMVAVPLDKELTDEGIAKLTAAADSVAIIYSATFKSCVKKMRNNEQLQAFIGMGDCLDGDFDYSMQQMIKAGRRKIRMKDTKYAEVVIDPDEMSEIIYTSGTTGANKGVMTSQRNVCTVVNAIAEIVPIEQTSISVLPISHTYEKNCHILGAVYLGARICFNDSIKYLISNMDLFKPGMSCMVPLFLESLLKNIWQVAEKTEMDKYLRYGLRISNLLMKVGIDQRKKFFKPVINGFGGNFRYIVCGGAPLRPETLRGLNEVGIEVANGYGITECSPLVTLNQNTWNDPYSIGKPVPGVQIRIGEKDVDGNGEILVKGDNVMLGYYKDPESTRASFDEDGWFKTGDFGAIDKKGRLFINGRKKNLIILDNGKNVHPEEIETILMDEVPYIKEVVVHSMEKGKEDKKQQIIAAQVFVDPEYMEQNNSTDINEILTKDIRKVNQKLPVYKQVHYIGISEEEFEKTTSKKIKRFKVLENAGENKDLKVV